jgi:hypothetical protein
MPSTLPLAALSRCASSKTMLGGLAAELERHWFEVARRGLVDRAARHITAGEGDFAHLRVGHQRLADLRAGPVTTLTTPLGSRLP